MKRMRRDRSVLYMSGAFAAGLVLLAVGVSAEVEFETVRPLTNKDCGTAETSIGDLFADAVRTTAKSDIAFVACSELKPTEDPYPAGKMSSSQLTALASYPNDPLVTMELQGTVVRAALERSVSLFPQPNMGFLQVSGLRFTFNPENPAGERVTSASVGSASLSDNTRYRVGMTASMAQGALGYWKVWAANDATSKIPGANMITALEAYLSVNTRIEYDSADRITESKK